MGTVHQKRRIFTTTTLIGFLVCLWNVRLAFARTKRHTVSFDFGWKHRAGLHNWPQDPYGPPINTTAIGRRYIDPGEDPKEASEDYNTSDWIDVDLPHDGLISNPFGNAPSIKACPDGCSGRSYIPRHVLWYRKQFKLPSPTINRGSEGTSTTSSSWQDELLEGTSRIYLRFDGSFRNTTVYLNGRRVANHESGYTPIRIELTPSTLGLVAPTETNPGAMANANEVHTVAVFVDPNNGDGGGPAKGSGWWYEGGGLYRHSWLEKVPRSGRVSHGGVFVTSNILTQPPESTDMATAVRASMELKATFEIEDWDESYCYVFKVSGTGIHEADEIGWDDGHTSSTSSRGAEMHKTNLRLLEAPSSESNDGITIINVTANLIIESPNLWTSSNPHLYEVTGALYKDCGTSDGVATTSDPILLDETSVYHGVRSIRFDADTGFYWNGVPYKIRGFCDHDTFAVVGMAVPDRINLFRAQASRSIGGNARRASHNPPDPVALDIYDRLGMLVIDENRLFDNNTRYVKTMADLVWRDRNHPSVVLWSFCNEVGCEGDREAGGPAFQSVTTELDGSRPTLANMFTFHDLLSDTIDVQGFSHRHRDVLDQCHADLPDKPIVMSECCSCNTMRDVDEGCETTSDNPHTTCDQKAFNARCLERLVNASDGTAYASGTFVWTLLDYYGEPPSRPLTVSSTYGQFDLCGFPKASAFWFRSQWLLAQPGDDTAPTWATDHRRLRNKPGELPKSALAIANGRPFDTKDLVEVHIVESWESPDHWNITRGNNTRTIHAYSNAPVIELYYVQGRGTSAKSTSLGLRTLVPMVLGDSGTYGEWKDIPWKPGRLTAVARSPDGTELARTTRETNSLSPSVSLVLSLDCPSPRTGTGDALLLDGSDVALIRGTLVDSTTNHTLVFAGDNRPIHFRVVQGPGKILGTANGDPKSKRSHTDPMHPAHHGLVRAIVGVTSTAGRPAEEQQLLRSMETIGHRIPSGDDEGDIVVEATSPGLHPVRLTIPTSIDPNRASVLAAAASGLGRPLELVMGSGFQQQELEK